jgi:hypothetical protein
MFSAKVYFKLKKPKDGIYRPLHITSLKDSITIVAMLQLLVFEMEASNENQMQFSNLAKTIPSNFYGNIPSKVPEQLFERWQEKYRDYSEKANDMFSQYEKTEEYKFEVTLDLENFFPSINPLLIYDYIIKSLEVLFDNKDLELIKVITLKLLYFKIEAYEDDEFKFFKELYYSDCSQNNGFSEIKINNNYITKGIPQGLPQAYFFGNLAMIKISEIYNKCFKGEALYYVDDSYIYTNLNLDDKLFKDTIDVLNVELKKYSLTLSGNKIKIQGLPNGRCFDGFIKQVNMNQYIMKVHTGEKSSYLSVKDTKTGYKYLKFLSRLASMGSFDFRTTFTDYEEINLKDKFNKLIEAINKEIEKYCEILQLQRGCFNLIEPVYYDGCIKCEKGCLEFEGYTEYFNKLKRFKRFFELRVLIIEMQESDKVLENIYKELMNIENDKIWEKFDEDLFEIKLVILDDFLLNSIDDIEDIDRCNSEDERVNGLKRLYDKVKSFEEHFAKKSEKYSSDISKKYFYYYHIFSNYKKINIKKNIDPYKSIGEIISKKINPNIKHHMYLSSENSPIF